MFKTITIHPLSLACGVAVAAAFMLLTSQATQTYRPGTEGRYQLLPANWRLAHAGDLEAGSRETAGVLLIDSVTGKTWKLRDGVDDDKKPVLQWSEVQGP
jgi:hypothetical protein